MREAARGVSAGAVALVCVALVASALIVGYVIFTVFVRALH
jgi:hypothetical protein